MAEVMEQDKRVRGQRKALVTRYINKMNRLLAEENEEAIKEHVEKLKDAFDNFEHAHVKYHEQLDTDELVEESDTYFFQVEADYVKALNESKGWLKSKISIQDIKADKSPNVNEVKMESPNAVASLVSLPKLELEAFDGDVLKYHSFIAIFDESVDKIFKEGNSKLMRLLQFTTGKARDAIRSCSLIGGEDGYKKAREILQNRFGDDHIITDRIVKELRSGKPIRGADDLQQLADEVSNCLLTLTRMERLSEVDSQSCIVEVINRLPLYLQTRWKRLAVEAKRNNKRYPGFKELVDFIVKEAEEENDPVYGNIHGKPVKNEKYVKMKDNKVVKSFSSGVNQNRKYECLVCKGDHRLLFCDNFRRMNVQERISLVREHRLCENCLIANHTASQCRKSSTCSVPGCGRKHTKYIHSVVSNDQITTERQGNTRNVNSALANESSQICVPIVTVRVNQQVMASALLDTGSTASFCTRKLVNELGISGVFQDYALSTLSRSGEQKRTEIIELTLQSPDGSESLQMKNVFVVEDIPVSVPCVDFRNYSHLQNLVLPGAGSAVDVLIGQDHGEALVPLETRVGRKSDPFAVRTLFGWSINGPTHSGRVTKQVLSNFVTTECLDQSVAKFWHIEDEGVSSDKLSWSVDDYKVIALWDAERKFVNGHYQLPIPFKESIVVPNNYVVAMSRLNSNIASLKKRGLMECYNAEIDKLVREGYAESVSDCNDLNCANIWYLPHHAVISEKKPGKVRIVFDCAAKFHGQSLNEKCLSGPDLNNGLLNVLFRFRNHKFAVMSDIQCMYYQVTVPPDQRDCLRFLWVNGNGEVVKFRMTSHVFGGVWSGSAAIYAMRQTLHDLGAVSEKAASVVNEGFYVDDCLVSFESQTEAVEVMIAVRDLLALGGFKLTKFVANDENILRSFPIEDRAMEVKDLLSGAYSKVLGVRWDVSSDCLYFDVNLSRKLDNVCKRTMLSFISSLFDPLGLVSPVLIKGKLLLQEVTKLKIDWDAVLPIDVVRRWHAWLESLLKLAIIRIPRCVKPHAFDGGVSELHHFSDASSVAYGCCSYLRSINAKGEVNVALLCAKSRVAPLKSTTIPRLELQGALTAARIDSTLRKEIHLNLLESHFWVDSEIVLKYISNDHCRFQVFVANRVGEIRSLTNPSQWHFISGSNNPADIVTRGMEPDKLAASDWVSGPEFLHAYKCDWSVNDVISKIDERDPEVCKSNSSAGTVVLSCVAGVTIEVPDNPVDVIITHFSSWARLTRAVAWWLRFKKFLKSKGQDVQPGKLLVADIHNAETLLLKHVQTEAYSRELESLNRGGSVPKTSSLRSLKPFLDQRGLLCVGGRLRNANMPECSKHQCIVPHSHCIAKLIVRECHETAAHVGTDWVLSLVREKYWITRARGLVKKIKHDCVTCKRLYGTPEVQLMADLPAERIEAGNPPFTFVGVDCFGPFKVKQGRSEVKRYGCLFSCFNTRAVHVEMLSGLDTDSFLNGLRRFISRRGLPKKIWSDNGTNFVGGLKEIEKSLKEMNWSKVQGYCTKRYIEWHFIPPGAPHMGGLWERMVRMIKKVFQAILGNITLYDDVLRTLLCEAESIINSRPITNVGSDPLDSAPLSPNHLLMLRAGPPSPPGLFEGGDLYRKRWRHVQFLAEQFWRRWIKEYLPLLQTRQKWTKVNSNVKEGDVVLVLNENTPRNLWPLGRVVRTNCSSDGLVRSVVVKTNATELVRPITKVVKLESSV